MMIKVKKKIVINLLLLMMMLLFSFLLACEEHVRLGFFQLLLEDELEAW